MPSFFVTRKASFLQLFLGNRIVVHSGKALLPSVTTLRVGLVVFFLRGVGKQSFLQYFLYSRFLQVMDDLTKHWNCLSLSEREGDDLCIKKDRRSQEYIITALFLTRRALNTEAVARTFKPLWRSKNGFEIQREGDHKILCVR